ncbi:MAG: hypothetical protein IPK10_06765 [Bacteroidetes bacterium]|nr:hypothetical protein [Bacteroidota bacterium]
MKKFLLLLTLFATLYSQVSLAQIPLTLTTPANVGACQLNSYIAKYQGQDSIQGISIASSIFNTATLTCGISNGSLVIVDSIKNLSGANITPIQTSIDSLVGSWSATLPAVSNTDSVFIFYHILIDCSIIPTGTAIPSLQLVQAWSDSTNTFFINGTVYSTDTSNTIKYPLLVNLSPTSYSLGFKDTTELSFIFANSGTATANINVTFNPDTSLIVLQ